MKWETWLRRVLSGFKHALSWENMLVTSYWPHRSSLTHLFICMLIHVSWESTLRRCAKCWPCVRRRSHSQSVTSGVCGTAVESGYPFLRWMYPVLGHPQWRIHTDIWETFNRQVLSSFHPLMLLIVWEKSHNILPPIPPLCAPWAKQGTKPEAPSSSQLPARCYVVKFAGEIHSGLLDKAARVAWILFSNRFSLIKMSPTERWAAELWGESPCVSLLCGFYHLWFLLHPEPLHWSYYWQLQSAAEKDKCACWPSWAVSPSPAKVWRECDSHVEGCSGQPIQSAQEQPGIPPSLAWRRPEWSSQS